MLEIITTVYIKYLFFKSLIETLTITRRKVTGIAHTDYPRNARLTYTTRQHVNRHEATESAA